jgi:hypothetical protein
MQPHPTAASRCKLFPSQKTSTEQDIKQRGVEVQSKTPLAKAIQL